MNPWERLVARLRPRRTARPQAVLQAINATRHTVLATRMTLADTPKSREKGLLGRDSIPAGEGLWIVPCQAIHMFFMRFPIDLVYIDRRHRVRKVRSSVAPWRISVCLTAHSVLELPAGIVRQTGTQPGDLLEISPCPQVAPTPDIRGECDSDHQGRLSGRQQKGTGRARHTPFQTFIVKWIETGLPRTRFEEH